jgi:NitT/TauT family transport system substrate-binding protein
MKTENPLMKRIIPVFILAALLLSACAGSKPPQNSELREITLNLTYIPNVQFAPFLRGNRERLFQRRGLNVRLNYGNEADLIALVGSGNQQFMIASGDRC